MSGVAAGALLLQVLLVAGAPHAAASATVAPRVTTGSILVRNDGAESDTVRFYFPRSASVLADERQVVQAATAAALANHGVSFNRGLSRSSNSKIVELETTLTRRTSFLTRRVDIAALRRLDVFGAGRLYLDLPAAARAIRGQLTPVGSHGVAHHEFLITGERPVFYRIAVSFFAVSMLVAALVVFLPWLLLRRLAKGLERKTIVTQVGLRRLRRRRRLVHVGAVVIGFVTWFVSGAIEVPVVLAGGLAPSVTRTPTFTTVAEAGFLVALLLTQVVVVYLAALPTYYLLQNSPRRSAPVRQLLVGTTVGILPVLVWFAVVTSLPPTVRTSPMLYPATLVGLLVAMSSLMPPLLVRAARSHPIDPPSIPTSEPCALATG
ncbi:MAG: hypothetical protein ACYDH6_24505 [Acidimicrobiales bacterium]